MIKDAVIVLDVGSSKITVTVGERGLNNTFVIHSSCDVSYAGFDENGFINGDGEVSVDRAVISAMDLIKRNSDVKLDTVFVGIPGYFLQTRTLQHVNSYEGKTKITENEVNKFIETGLFDIKMQDYCRIDSRAIYFTLSDGSVVNNPIGKKSVNLRGVISVTFCKAEFKTIFDKILFSLGVNKVRYVSSPLCECLYLFNEDKRNEYNVLLDVGFTTSTLSVVYKNGIVYQRTLDGEIGGSSINNHFYFSLGFESNDFKDETLDILEDLKRKVNLGIKDGEYICCYGGQVYKFAVDSVNSLVNEVLTVLAGQVSESIEKCSLFLPVGTRINLTGGGVSYIRGAGEKLRDLLDRGVDIVCPNVPRYKKPSETSKFALLNYALNMKN